MKLRTNDWAAHIESQIELDIKVAIDNNKQYGDHSSMTPEQAAWKDLHSAVALLSLAKERLEKVARSEEHLPMGTCEIAKLMASKTEDARKRVHYEAHCAENLKDATTNHREE